jgi:hypothetical protein
LPVLRYSYFAFELLQFHIWPTPICPTLGLLTRIKANLLQDNKNGLGLTKSDSIDFINFLAAKAHSLNLSIGLKNAGDIIPAVLPVVDFSVNEQCVQYDECEPFTAFVKASKPVFHIEYPSELKSKTLKHIYAKTGPATQAAEFSTVLKNMDLDGWVQFCDESTAETRTGSS